MKISGFLRIPLAIVLTFSLLSPLSAAAFGDGKKFFNKGMKHEVAEEWDLAAEQFALAVSENPKNPEYRLHLQRALFQASQMFMRKGKTASEQKDFEGAYLAFRKAYAFDPTNELAKSEMARMVRLQEEVQKGKDPNRVEQDDKNNFVPAGYAKQQKGPSVSVPQKFEQLRNLPFPGGIDLQTIIKDLARTLDLNVLFDAESRLDGRKVKIDLINVTPAKGLDYIFLQENLFFQRVGPRTILVASNNRRINLQQLVLRTFYLANADPKKVKPLIMQAIPPQPGRSQTIVLEDEPTNSLTVRDTEENVRLIGRLIQSLDKDRAEVVMDVAIYEVNKSDLLKLGNQIGSEAGLSNIGGVGIPLIRTGPSQPITGGMPSNALNMLGYADAFATALGLPISTFQAFQSNNNTKLIASTQIHAFNNEDSSARIGQRVPVRTASFAPIANSGNNNNNNFIGDVYNYEQVGLTLKFKPIVFPNQDVQVAMEIESKDVAGTLTQQPVFIERTIKGTARVQNNKTLLLAGVAQNSETKGRAGLPLVGLIPILGRLFTAPTRDNRQVDIVMAITPRVIRAPAILPDDEVERPTGSVATPTNGSLEALIVEEEREELLAAARRLPASPVVQLPDALPEYVQASNLNQVQTPETGLSLQGEPKPMPGSSPDLSAMGIKPIGATVKSFDVNRTSLTSPSSNGSEAVVRAPEANAPLEASFRFASDPAEMKKGEKARIAILVEGSTAFRSAILGLRFDGKKTAVRTVVLGEVFGRSAIGVASVPFINQNGKMYVSLTASEGTASGQGILAYVEIEALEDGKPKLVFEKDVMNLLSSDGKNFLIKF